MELSGQIALVTGASRGIGAAIAHRLAEGGARVAVNYRTGREAAEAVVQQIRTGGGTAFTVQADVSQPSDVTRMLAQIREQYGSPAILINNAGVLIRGDLADFDFSGMDRMRGTNVDGLTAVTRACVPAMMEAGYGRIVNLASVAAHGSSMPGTTFYAATKAAVVLLTRRFAMDLGPHGITVNAIAPGFIRTEMVTAGRTPAEAEKLCADIAAKAMMRRTGTPDDIAQAVAFLVSPRSGFVTAQILTVDGGRMDYLSHL